MLEEPLNDKWILISCRRICPITEICLIFNLCIQFPFDFFCDDLSQIGWIISNRCCCLIGWSLQLLCIAEVAPQIILMRCSEISNALVRPDLVHKRSVISRKLNAYFFNCILCHAVSSNMHRYNTLTLVQCFHQWEGLILKHHIRKVDML